MSFDEVNAEVLRRVTRVSGNVESVAEFQYNRTDLKFAISQAIKETAKQVLEDTLGVIEKEYVDWNPHHSGFAINRIDFHLLKEEVKKKWRLTKK